MPDFGTRERLDPREYWPNAAADFTPWLADDANIRLLGSRLHVRHGKGDKARVVPFAARCADALAAYCADRGPAPGPLFLAARYARLNAGVRLRAERAQTAAATPRPGRRRPARPCPSLPPHVRHLGYRP